MWDQDLDFGCFFIVAFESPFKMHSCRRFRMSSDVNRFQTPWYQTPHFCSIDWMPRGAQALSLREIFARNVRLVRVNAGISQERMANDADLDRAFIGTLERGLRNISIDNIELIAKALGYQPHELMDPSLPKQRGLDETLTRAPRTVRPYAIKKRARSS